MEQVQLKPKREIMAYPGRTEPLRDAAARVYLDLVIAERRGVEARGELPILSAIVQKRIEALKLHIRFTSCAIRAVSLLVLTPGAAVVLLVDALTAYEGDTVSVEKLTNLYPYGFYNEVELDRIIDTEMKPKAVRWSEIY